MKFALIFLFVLTLTAEARSQGYLSDSITTPNKGNVFYQKGMWLGTKQLLELTKPYPEAHKEMIRAKSNKDGAMILGFVGGFMVGWPLGTALAGGEPNWAIAGAGAGLILIGIPLGSAYRRHACEAARIYNREAFKEASSGMRWEFCIRRDAMGLRLSF